MSFSDEDKVTFAALCLYDGGCEITADNLKALISASNNTTAPYWPALYSGLLKGDTIEKIINTCGGGSGGAAAAAAPAGGNFKNRYISYYYYFTIIYFYKKVPLQLLVVMLQRRKKSLK